MSIAAGSRLGPFEILAPLGAGGMGEVWRARDPRLQREVAIKVLPAALAADPERLARFEREARVLASMNHPRIGGLLGLEDAAGVPALVLELIEGPTLAEHLAKRGALPAAEAIDIAQQIAEAMEYAHERGIVHRDLKPANVKFTADESVKVLDFGLAKALLGDDGGSADPQISQSPTRTVGTHVGVLLGTAAYMAPEQARGRPVDRRADIWAFGVVLFEMLSGRPLFAGETVSDTIARILEREPDWNALPPATPERLRELLQRCLEKDVRKRLRDIGDARLDLEAARREAASGIPPGRAGLPARLPWWAWAGVLALAAAAFAAGAWLRAPAGSVRSEVARLSIVPPADLSVRNLWISPDGKTVLALGTSHDRDTQGSTSRQLYRRAMDRFEWEPIAGTEGADSYDVVSDGQWVYFVGPTAPGSPKLRMARVALDGSVPPAGVIPWPAAWSAWEALPQGGFAVVIGNDSVGVIRPAEEAPRQWRKILSDRPLGELNLHETLPGGKACFGTAGYFSDQGWNLDAVALDLDTGALHTIEKNAASPRLTPHGRVVFTRGATVLAAAFDEKTLQRTSEPVALFRGVRLAYAWDHGSVNISGDGTLVYAPGTTEARARWIAMLHPDGREEEWCPERLPFEQTVSVSPDGQRAVVTNVPPGTSSYEVLLLTRGRPGSRRIASAAGEDCGFPVFSPDGRSVAYMRQGLAAGAGIYVLDLESGAPARLVLPAKDGIRSYDSPTGWSPDGRTLFVQTFEDHAMRIRALALGGGSAPPRELYRAKGSAGSAVLSSDGRTLAFLEYASGPARVFVADYRADGTLGQPVQVSNAGATSLCWVPGTRTLTFVTSARDLMQCRVGPDLSFEPPVLRAGLAERINNGNEYTIAADGSVVLVHKGEDEGEIRQFDLVLGFDREVERSLARKRRP